ncbi:MAG: branched-chain amino acid transport system substrate-binding protein [Gaiellaceae bacterium]|nr:branched-chain amino acid transport system substrate-binding protein [Gaiellaceae bacterium]MDX6472606.1 branched-chain amino acid transport system substrate-binding protein [Gaiellaceae bacterium]
MSRKFSLLALVGAAVVVAAVAAGYSGSARGAASVSPLPSSSCGPVVYKGSGTPDFIIASDLPLQGAIRHQTVEISRAMIWALAEKGWKAGSYKIGYQSCDDSTAQTGGWDTAKCATNAHLYANNKSVMGVIGTFNSGCAKIEVPTLNRASLAMVSPANTNPGLTKKWDVGEPNKYYPTGTRNYARVVATDDIQGPADALWSQSLGFKKVFVLNDKQTYGFGVAKTYQAAAKKLGIKVVGFQGWDAKASSYEALATSIKASGAQAVFLGGIACNNGAKLMQDIKSVNPKIQLQMPDGFSDPGANGAVGNGAYISVAGEPPNALTGQGATFVKSFGKQIGTTPNPYAAYGAQAMLVMLQAVSTSGGQRAAATKALFGIQITNGILGNFSINASGDTNLTPITIYKQAGKNLNPVKTLVPTASLIGG